MSKFQLDTFNELRGKAMHAAAEAMGIALDVVPVVTMDERSQGLAAADVFGAFERGEISRDVINSILSGETGTGDGQIRPAFQAEIASRLHKWTGRSVC